MIKYLLLIAAYLFLPFIVFDTGTFIILLLIAYPLICFLLAFFPGMKYGFEWLFPIMCGILFIPVIYFKLNETAYIYCIIYPIFAFFGSGIGGFLKARFTTNKIED